MNLLPAIPLELRLAALFILGTLVGSLVNLAAYHFAWNRRWISPWSEPPPEVAPRDWLDRVPVIGWLALKREARFHGRAFWVRPLLVELATGLGFAALYGWEIQQHGLYPEWLPPDAAISITTLHLQYFSHLILISAMLAASLIDVDERLIPDEITVTGTVAGLILAAVLPWTLLPHVTFAAAPPQFSVPLAAPGLARIHQTFLTLPSPHDWPAALDGAPRWGSLGIGLGCYWLWCFALLPRPWYGRHGARRAMAVLAARMGRGLTTRPMLALILAGTAAIAATWAIGGQHWAGLLSALVGLAAAGGLVWAVRLIGTAVLKKEAMGFGDVLLMMMIGTYVGWQPSLVIFFLAPFAGLVIGIAQYILFRDQAIPYGPFLCLATLVTILTWARIWDHAQRIFQFPLLVPTVIVGCLAAMAVMLMALRLLRETFFQRTESP